MSDRPPRGIEQAGRRSVLREAAWWRLEYPSFSGRLALPPASVLKRTGSSARGGVFSWTNPNEKPGNAGKGFDDGAIVTRSSPGVLAAGAPKRYWPWMSAVPGWAGSMTADPTESDTVSGGVPKSSTTIAVWPTGDPTASV